MKTALLRFTDAWCRRATGGARATIAVRRARLNR
jgi:hypothetical protein